MEQLKERVKQMLENTPAANFTSRILVECRCRSSANGQMFFESKPLPSKGFVLMEAIGLSLTENNAGLYFRVGLSNKDLPALGSLELAKPFFKYFRYVENKPTWFPMPKIGGFAYTELSQLVVAPDLKIVVESNNPTTEAYDVTFSLIIHKLHPNLLSALDFSQKPN